MTGLRNTGNPPLTEPQSDSMWNLRSLAECLLNGPKDGPVNVGLARDLARAALTADDLLRRLSEWDMLYVKPDGTGITADGPYWQREIAKGRAANG